MASFRGLYDKLVSYILDTSKVNNYEPVSNDYVAVYDSTGPRNSDNNATWMPKKYVPVTTIGTGGGPTDGITSFDVIGVNGVEFSTNGGATYSNGATVNQSGMTLYIDVQSVPNGLNWTGPYSSSTIYSINDVVSTNYNSGGVAIYSTWWCQQNSVQNEAPPTNATSNAYWVQLGTQGPAGATGAEGPPNAIATSAFRTATTSTNVLAAGPNVGTNNDRGVFILMENTGSATLTIPSGLSTDPTTGIPLNSQVSVMKMNNTTVQVVPASGVTLRSADNATYLRTQYSSATLIRKAANEWYLFGDLTNIA